MAKILLVLTLLALTPLVVPASAEGISDPQQTAPGLDAAARSVDTSALSGNWPLARAEWSEFQSRWLAAQEGFREASPEGYRSIDNQMKHVDDALYATIPAPQPAHQELSTLRLLIQAIVDSTRDADSAPADPSETSIPMSTAVVPFVLGDQGTAVPTPSRPSQPSLSVSLPTPTPVSTPVPSTCSVASIALTPPYVRSDGYTTWQVSGFKPGTAVLVAVSGPSANGAISGPFLMFEDSAVVDTSCQASDTMIMLDVANAFPNLGSGHYVVTISGTRYGAPESRLRLSAPFTVSTVAR